MNATERAAVETALNCAEMAQALSLSLDTSTGSAIRGRCSSVVYTLRTLLAASPATTESQDETLDMPDKIGGVGLEG